jgi:hypothetical protein|eukprot:COSAG06_NODE_2060_length_7699_cov_21.717105_5_plen_157_part_00
MTAARRSPSALPVGALLLLAAALLVAPAVGNTPAPEPIGAAAARRGPKKNEQVSACDCDLCGSKGFASPPDGKVNVHDILKFMMHMGKGKGQPMAVDDHPCDVNTDNVVDISDLLLMFKRFGDACAEHEEAGWSGLHFGGDWNPAHLFDRPQDSGL